MRIVTSNAPTPKRCGWSSIGNDLEYLEYHDKEWGVPVHEDKKIFEFLVLEGAQAGLNWLTILKKRKNFRKAFANFDPRVVAKFNSHDVQDLLSDPGIIRNKLKITSAINNAKSFLKVQEEFGSFDKYIWGFMPGAKPRKNSRRSLAEIPARTKQSDSLSEDLIRRGFTFVGSTICYAHMQATGMVNDHLVSCFRYSEV